ncbi:acetylornithine transaminase [Cytobacillus gottheilii]|uniref:Acetylornithine aminotransferase n=1 Tax=Cytobacillus gottheilii TaxID=859144 RepID=A0ABX8FFV7_9BACI|nr:acetylornithine transaminase [Cytobacillus gottheilii]QVY62870.1 acetylornithine transaminase [Cytobacillus gottheilii]
MSYLFPVYSKWEVEPISAEGSRLIDKSGNNYLDFTSGIGVCNLGHRPANVQKAIENQLNSFWHVSNLFIQSKQDEAAKLLAEAAGLDLVFFSNSGAEANEAGIKLARKATGRNKIITFSNSFHGRTFAAMSATGQKKIQTGFGPLLQTFKHVSFNDLAGLTEELDEDTAAVMLEIVQGEGGIHIAAKEFLKELQNLCQSNGTLLIVDEIQTGMGRTGKPFAYQHFDLTPDIVTVAKGLGSGLPIGAVIGSKKLEEAFGPGSHGSTFGGNPISVTAATVTMQTIFEPGFLKEVMEKADYLKNSLKELLSNPFVADVRQLGLMAGIELRKEAAPILAQLREKGLLLLPAGENVIRILPPLTATYEQIDEAMYIVKAVLNEVHAKV